MIQQLLKWNKITTQGDTREDLHWRSDTYLWYLVYEFFFILNYLIIVKGGLCPLYVGINFIKTNASGVTAWSRSEKIQDNAADTIKCFELWPGRLSYRSSQHVRREGVRHSSVGTSIRQANCGDIVTKKTVRREVRGTEKEAVGKHRWAIITRLCLLKL